MTDSIWSDEWGEQGEDWSGGGGRSKPLPRAAERPGLGVTLYELDPEISWSTTSTTPGKSC